MNHWLRATFLASVVSCGTLWPTGVGAEQAPVLTPEQWREDLRFFARELPKRHESLYHSVSREELDRAIADLDTAIGSLEPHEIVVRLQQIAARIGDGHTGVHTPSYFQLYPLSLYWFGPELRVVGAAGEYARAVGTRVVKIGGLDIAKVESRIRTCFPSAEHGNEWYAMSTSPAFIVRPEVLHALRIVLELGPATFTLEDDAGTLFALDVRPIVTPAATRGAISVPGAVSAVRQQPLYRQQPGNPFWFTYLADSKTVYVNFRGYDSLRDNARALFRLIDENPTRRVVVDLRQNGGGDFFEGRQHLIHPLQ